MSAKVGGDHFTVTLSLDNSVRKVSLCSAFPGLLHCTKREKSSLLLKAQYAFISCPYYTTFICEMRLRHWLLCHNPRAIEYCRSGQKKTKPEGGIADETRACGAIDKNAQNPATPSRAELYAPPPGQREFENKNRLFSLTCSTLPCRCSTRWRSGRSWACGR